MRWRRRGRDTGPVPDGEVSTVRVIQPDAPEGPADAVDVADAAVLGELSAAFGARTTLTITDDDLPDAVYLDAGDDPAGQDATPGTVFIDDDGSADALASTVAAAPEMEPLIRQRRIRVKREAGRRRLRVVALVVAVVAVVVAVLAVLGSSLFAVDEVAISGAVYTDRARLQAVVDDLEGAPVLLVDTGRAERELERIPWVQSARVRTRFPDRVTIELRERTPVVSMQGEDGRFRVLDAEGRVLASIDGQPIALMWISGPGTLDVEEGEFAPVGPAAAASLVTKLTPEIRGRVESILVTPDGTDLRMVLTHGDASPIEVRFGSAVGDNDQIEKLVRLSRQLDDLGDEPVSVIDVSTADVGVS